MRFQIGTSILGALDDKIELNRKMNETLEAMARAIFKSWFVDFDPIPTIGPHKEWQDSPLGRIPKGWKVLTIGDVIELAYEKALKEEIRQPGKIPVYGSNGQVGWHNEKLVDGPGIVVGRKGNPGIVTWAQTNFYPIDTTFYVVPKGIIKSMYYLFHALHVASGGVVFTTIQKFFPEIKGERYPMLSDRRNIVVIAEELKKALADYTGRDRDMTGIPQEEAVAVILEKYEIVTSILHGFNYLRFFVGNSAERLTVIKEAMEHILSIEDGKNRFMQAVTELSKAFALAAPHEKAIEIRDEVGFSQAICSSLSKNTWDFRKE